ncbi:hypothetical protein GGI12_004771 [Dipsacomyces acuminosporus]|nr:hypothetical protein GGI12_004771 [Dipsacomyces acuminosporus]
MGGPLNGLPGSNTVLPAQPQPQGQPHAGGPVAPHAHPYGLMLGIPGLYDDRMPMPHHPAAPGNWLRIRQPIDYVAPLKKPMNSFLLYSAERRVQLRQTHPELNTTQQSTILAREWSTLPEEEKERYRAEAKQLRDDYNARRAELSLKLQQQLSQQHLNMNLGHPQLPPPPPPPPPLPPPLPTLPLPPPPMPHGPSQSLELLDAGIVAGEHCAHIQTPASFGFQQPFGTANMQPQPHSFSQNIQSSSFSQSTHGDQHAQLIDSMAGPLQVDGSAFSSLESAGSIGISPTNAFSCGGQVSQFQNSAPQIKLSDDTAAEEKWPDIGLPSADMFQDVSSTLESHGLMRSPSNISQYTYASDINQQFRQSKDALFMQVSQLNNQSSLFGGAFDGAFQVGQLGQQTLQDITSLSSVDSIGLHQSISHPSITDVGTLHSAESSGALDQGGLQASNESPGADRKAGSAAIVGCDALTGDARHSRAMQEVGGESTASSSNNNAGSSTSSVAKSRGRLSSPAKRVRKKSKKDPDAPKHPMSAFLYYLTSERPRLADQLSDMSIGQQTRVIAQKWKSMDESDRAPWEELAKHDKDRYARERREYHSESRHSATPAATN